MTGKRSGNGSGRYRPADDQPAAVLIDRRNRWGGEAPCMCHITHVHADHDPRAWHWFARGPIVAADGGRRDDETRRRGRNVEDEQLRDVSHAPPSGDGANRVWDRGDEANEDDPE